MTGRLIAPIGDGELTRRWIAASDILRRNDLDVLVVQNSNDWMAGYVRWFTGVPATNGYPRTVRRAGEPGDKARRPGGERSLIRTP